MIDTKRKEEISKSYLNALCATSGIAMEVQSHDDDGLDVVLKKILRRSDGSRYNAQISVQLKSTSSDYSEIYNCYSYPLRKKNYSDLLMPATLKAYLFLLILPTEERDWVSHDIEQLVIRKCMFWHDLTGLPDSSNSTSATVHLPKENAVSSETLETLLQNIAEEV